MNKSIEIKEVNIRDENAVISSLMHGLHQSEQEMFNKTALWKDIEKDYLKHLTCMQEECDGTCLVAYNGETAVGFIFGYVEEQDESRIEIYLGQQLYVSDGFVLAEYRRQGIYKNMNDLLEQKYIKKGVQRITRFTLANNERMKNFLQQADYKPTRILFEKWL